MDRPDADPKELARSLDELGAINTWIGGWWSVRQALTGALGPEGLRGAALLDVATGGGDLARRVARRAAGGWITAMDLHPVTLDYARRRAEPEHGMAFVQADATALPFRSAAFDVALCSLTLHHFGEAAAVRVLREMDRVTRTAVIVTDLRRSRLAWVLILLLTRLLWRSRIVQHDGPVSVRRAYTPAELRKLAEQAGLIGARVFQQPLFRMALIYRKGAVRPG